MILRALRECPELKEPLVELVGELGKEVAGGQTADQAEDLIVERVRQLGRTVLTGWAQAKHAAVTAKQEAVGQQRHTKKNSGG